ncbi:hypothetical protein ACHAXR_003906 [Thalassiosira sp. AJA248-18]
MKKSNESNAACAATGKKKHDDPCIGKPYNRYNIYFILERERFLQSNSKYSSKTAVSDACSANFITGYENLDLPNLPKRYECIDLPRGWYMPGKRKAKKRDHKKTHGLASFQEIARVVADGWKSVDDETLEYCSIVAEMLKQRHKELKAHQHMMQFSSGDSTGGGNSKSFLSYDKTNRRPMHPSHNWAPGVSDQIVSTHHDADDACFAPITTKRHGNDDAKEADIQSPPSMGEVDMPDQDIMTMWHIN